MSPSISLFLRGDLVQTLRAIAEARQCTVNDLANDAARGIVGGYAPEARSAGERFVVRRQLDAGADRFTVAVVTVHLDPKLRPQLDQLAIQRRMPIHAMLEHALHSLAADCELVDVEVAPPKLPELPSTSRARH